MVLVVIRDSRWGSDPRGILGQMEIDLSTGTELVYFLPDQMMTIRDFYDHFQLVVKVKGYDSWVGGEANLLITKALVGRLSNTSNTTFRYAVGDLVEYLATKGVRALPGQRYDVAQYEAERWTLEPPSSSTIRVPSQAHVWEDRQGSTSIRFTGYGTQASQQPSFGRGDEEALAEEEEIETARMVLFVNVTDDGITIERRPPVPAVYPASTSNQEKFEEDMQRRKKEGENWGTLGDDDSFLVKYSAPPITPIEDIVPTGWGDDEEKELAMTSKGTEICFEGYSVSESEKEEEAYEDWENPFAVLAATEMDYPELR